MPRRPLLSISITREGWAYVFMLAIVLTGAILRDINLLTLIAGLMLGPLLFNLAAVAWGLRNLKIDRDVPTMVVVGERLVAEVTLANRRPRRAAWMIIVVDSIERIGGPAPGEKIAASVVFTCVLPSETVRATYRCELSRRGRYRLGPLRVQTRFPLGLARHVKMIENERTVIVAPQLRKLRPSARPWMPELLAGSSAMKRHGLTEGEFHGLRDWRAGDSRRWIHWRTTARRGELVVRQFEQPQQDDLAILVDLHQPVSPTAEDLRQVERAICLAATLAAEYCRRGGGAMLLLSTGAPPVALRGSCSPGLLTEALSGLAIVEANAENTWATEAVQRLGALSPRAQVVLISTREAAAPPPAIAARLRQSSQRSANVRTVCTASPDYDEWFEPQLPAPQPGQDEPVAGS